MLTLPWSEIAALVGLISVVCGVMGSIGMLFLSSKFVSKKTHYYEKDELWKALHAAEDRITKLEEESKLAKQPIVTMQKSFDAMQGEFEKLIITVNAMDKSVGSAIHAVDTRLSILEAMKTRRKA